MEAKYSRIFTDNDGKSRIEDMTSRLEIEYAVPPAKPLHMKEFMAAEGTFWLGIPPDWEGIRHPAPMRAIFVTVQGEYQLIASDGVPRRYPIGSVLLLEDTTGDGHVTTIEPGEDCYVICVKLKDQ